MPTLKILIGDKLVDAEIVVRNGALFAKVPDEYIGSSMPLLTAKLQAQTEAVGMLLGVGDFVRAAEKRFPELYGDDGADRAKMLAGEYQLCREMYEAGRFDLAKEKLSALKGQVEQEMVSFELAKMVKKELEENPKSSKKVRVTKKDEQEVFHMAARFDGARLEARLFGASIEEPVGELLDLPNTFSTMPMQITGSCSCNCEPPSIPNSGYCGWILTVRRFSYGSLTCQDQITWGSITKYFKTAACSVLEQPSTKCEKIRDWYFPGPSS